MRRPCLPAAGALRAALLAAATFVILGCEVPYNADVNLAGRLTSRMTQVGVVGPMDVTGDQLSTTRSVFLPARPAAVDIGAVAASSGVVVSTDGFFETLGFGWVDESGNAFHLGAKSYPLFGSDPSYPAHLTFVGPTAGTTGTVLVAALDPNMPPPNGISGSFDFWTAPLPQGPLSFASSSLYTDMLPSPWNVTSVSVVGLCVQPQPSLPDLSFWLLYDGSTYAEVQFDVPAGSAFTNPTTPAPLSLGFLGAATRCQYYHYGVAGSGVSYASFLQAGAWQCWRWEAGGTKTQQLAAVTHRVDGLLSTGELLSFDDGTLRLYDPAGNQVSSTPLEGLLFCYEAYVGATPYVFFCQPMHFSHQSWAYRVYAIPTADLKSLG